MKRDMARNDGVTWNVVWFEMSEMLFDAAVAMCYTFHISLLQLHIKPHLVKHPPFSTATSHFTAHHTF